MKKCQTENWEKSEISEKLFPVFLFPNFPTAKIENSDLKILGKNFLDFQVFNLARFTVLDMKNDVPI